ncbi:iron chelate uptake ABC transporter family permease subunit [Actinotalea ferrariae]|uniref:FecCD family ABC transporter permease n=1 Tax=Actinotalea ferrariae TaxID=1386098 RepID=UPI001C8C70F8|nr:iron chelate uptake ABC transporter family permease subunit [Actinotalea ferrariae]MBX9246857.1 iron chelate uptake ABC transporter family permease subunit [Actinotalea ferrariae]
MTTVTAAGGPVQARATRPAGSSLRRAAVLVVALVLLVLAVALSIAVGARGIPLADVWRHLWSPDGSSDAAIVQEVRLPRTLLGIAAGAALGLSGALMQSMTRNPLAEPGLLGVNAGAAVAVVGGISLLGLTGPRHYVWLALLGAGVATVLVYVVGSRGGRAASATPVRLTLAGAAISAVLMAGVWAMTFLDREALDLYRYWAVGSLSGRDLGVLGHVLPFLVVGTAVGLLLAAPLNAMALGEDTGRALGLRPGVVRAVTGLVVTVLCGAATAAVGPLVFVGLAVPHAVRGLTGPDDRWVLPLSTLAAPVLLLLADVLGRVVAAPAEIQVGVVTAFLGAPVLIALAGRRRVAAL